MLAMPQQSMQETTPNADHSSSLQIGEITSSALATSLLMNTHIQGMEVMELSITTHLHPQVEEAFKKNQALQ